MTNSFEICGKCKYHRTADCKEDWICTNEDSEYYADYTEYTDKCEEFEER